MKTSRGFLKGFFTALMVLFVCFGMQAQTDSVYTGTTAKKDSLKRKAPKNDAWKDKVTYGGNFQLQFGTYTFIYLSPTIGYLPVKNFNFGVGVIYNYISINYGAPYGKYAQSIYGSHTYARYYVTDNFFVQGQFDKLRQPNIYSSDPNAKTWVDYVLVGGGLRQPIGDRAALSTALMYNLTPSDLSIYPLRIIIQFGFISTF